MPPTVGRKQGGQRPRDEHQHERQQQALEGESPSSDGNTSSPSVKNTAICPSPARPWWKAVTVRRAGIDALPRTSPAM